MNSADVKNVYIVGIYLSIVLLISTLVFYSFRLFPRSIMLICCFVLCIICFLNLSTYKTILSQELLSTASNVMVAITIVASGSYVFCISFMLAKMLIHRLCS